MKYLVISSSNIDLISKIKEIIKEDADTEMVCMSDSIEETSEILKLIDAGRSTPVVLIGNTIIPQNHLGFLDEKDLQSLGKLKDDMLLKSPFRDSINLSHKITMEDIDEIPLSKAEKLQPYNQSYKRPYKHHK